MASDNVQVTVVPKLDPLASRSLASQLQKDLDAVRIKAFENRVSTNQLNSAQNATKQLGDTFEKTGRQARSFGDQLTFTTNRLAAYYIAAGAIFRITRAVGEAGGAIVELDKQISRLTQIFDGNRQEANRLTDQVLQFGVAYGQSGREVLKIADILAQAGDKFGNSADGVARVAKEIAKTNLAATFSDIRSTTEGVIGILSQFNLTGAETGKILDLANNLAKKFASESSDLFEAVRAGGGAFSLADNDIKNFAATVTALRSITRLTAAQVGTALNTISVRNLREDIIQFTDELTKGGIRNADGSIKGLTQRFIEVAKATKGFNDEQLGPVIEKLSDVRQAKFLIPLIRDIQKGKEGGSQFFKALDEANRSAGSSARDAAEGLNRIEVQLERIGARFDQVFKSISQDEGIKDLVRNFGTLADAAATSVEAIRPLLPVMIKAAALGLAFSAFRLTGRAIAGGGISGILERTGVLPESKATIVAKSQGRGRSKFDQYISGASAEQIAQLKSLGILEPSDYNSFIKNPEKFLQRKQKQQEVLQKATSVSRTISLPILNQTGQTNTQNQQLSSFSNYGLAGSVQNTSNLNRKISLDILNNTKQQLVSIYSLAEDQAADEVKSKIKREKKPEIVKLVPRKSNKGTSINDIIVAKSAAELGFIPRPEDVKEIGISGIGRTTKPPKKVDQFPNASPAFPYPVVAPRPYTSPPRRIPLNILNPITNPNIGSSFSFIEQENLVPGFTPPSFESGQKEIDKARRRKQNAALAANYNKRQGNELQQLQLLDQELKANIAEQKNLKKTIIPLSKRYHELSQVIAVSKNPALNVVAEHKYLEEELRLLRNILKSEIEAEKKLIQSTQQLSVARTVAATSTTTQAIGSGSTNLPSRLGKFLNPSRSPILRGLGKLGSPNVIAGASIAGSLGLEAFRPENVQSSLIDPNTGKLRGNFRDVNRSNIDNARREGTFTGFSNGILAGGIVASYTGNPLLGAGAFLGITAASTIRGRSKYTQQARQKAIEDSFGAISQTSFEGLSLKDREQLNRDIGFLRIEQGQNLRAGFNAGAGGNEFYDPTQALSLERKIANFTPTPVGLGALLNPTSIGRRFGLKNNPITQGLINARLIASDFGLARGATDYATEYSKSLDSEPGQAYLAKLREDVLKEGTKLGVAGVTDLTTLQNTVSGKLISERQAQLQSQGFSKNDAFFRAREEVGIELRKLGVIANNETSNALLEVAKKSKIVATELDKIGSSVSNFLFNFDQVNQNIRINTQERNARNQNLQLFSQGVFQGGLLGSDLSSDFASLRVNKLNAAINSTKGKGSGLLLEQSVESLLGPFLSGSEKSTITDLVKIQNALTNTSQGVFSRLGGKAFTEGDEDTLAFREKLGGIALNLFKEQGINVTTGEGKDALAKIQLAIENATKDPRALTGQNPAALAQSILQSVAADFAPKVADRLSEAAANIQSKIDTDKGRFDFSRNLTLRQNELRQQSLGVTLGQIGFRSQLGQSPETTIGALRGVINQSLQGASPFAGAQKVNDATNRFYNAINKFGEGSNEANEAARNLTIAQDEYNNVLNSTNTAIIALRQSVEQTNIAFQSVRSTLGLLGSKSQGDFNKDAFKLSQFSGVFGGAIRGLSNAGVTDFNSFARLSEEEKNSILGGLSGISGSSFGQGLLESAGQYKGLKLAGTNIDLENAVEIIRNQLGASRAGLLPGFENAGQSQASLAKQREIDTRALFDLENQQLEATRLLNTNLEKLNNNLVNNKPVASNDALPAAMDKLSSAITNLTGIETKITIDSNLNITGADGLKGQPEAIAQVVVELLTQFKNNIDGSDATSAQLKENLSDAILKIRSGSKINGPSRKTPF